MKVCPNTPNFIKIGKNSRQFTWRFE